MKLSSSLVRTIAICAVLAALPAVAQAAGSSSDFFKLGLGSDVDGKTVKAGETVINIFKLVVFVLGAWRFVMFITKKEIMDLVYVVVAAAGVGFAPHIVNAAYGFFNS